MAAYRYALLFSLPPLLVALLEYLTFPMQEQVRAQAGDWINRALSSNPDVSRKAHAELLEHEMLGAISYLDWLFLGSVVLGVIALSFLIPTQLIVSKGINFLTAVILGFASARLFVGFHHLDWIEFGVAVLVGALGAVFLMLMRLWGQRRSM